MDEVGIFELYIKFQRREEAIRVIMQYAEDELGFKELRVLNEIAVEIEAEINRIKVEMDKMGMHEILEV